MMSDHWKSLANFLGTPGPAEPVAKESTKKKPVTSPTSDDFGTESAAPSQPPRDPLAEIVDRQPDPIVPGFDVPRPAPVAEKPAKRSAWDTLIGTLGIKTSSEPEPVQEPERPVAVSGPARIEPELPSLKSDAPAKRGFGSGLVDDVADDDWNIPPAKPEPRHESRPEAKSPAPEREFASREPSRGREDRGGRPERSRDERGRNEQGRNEQGRRDAGRTESRGSESRSGEPRPARTSESRSSESRSKDSRSARPSEPRRGDRPQRKGFADGLIDWDAVPDDEYSRDPEFVTDDVELDIEDSDEPIAFGEPAELDEPAPRGRTDEDSRPRGRGRRGGSRNRGRGPERVEDQGPAIIEDAVDWHAEVDSDREPATRGEPARGDARRDGARDDRRPRREGGRESGREPRRDEPRRDEPRREEARRDEPRRDEARREVPSREEARRDDQPASETTGESRRRGRRGQRQQMGAPDVESRGRRDPLPREREASFADDDDLIIDESVEPELFGEVVAEAGEAPSRPRRRRGRRGRGGSGERGGREQGPAERSSTDRASGEPRHPSERSAPAARGGFEEELPLDAIDPIELDDDHEDAEEVERIRRGRRRGRGRGDSRSRSETSDVAGDSSAPTAAGSDEPSSGRQRSVPTWLDTINLLVDSNVERHRRSGPPRSSQGRGGRR